MSPKKRRRTPHRPNHRPHDQRRANAAAARQTIPPELLSMMLSAGRDMVRSDSPLETEEIASSLLGIWWGRELIDADVEEVLGQAMVVEAARRRSTESLTLLTAVASVAEGGLAVRAATAAQTLDQVGVTGPPWLTQVGRVEPVACFRTWDTAGDGVSVIGLFAHAGEPPHAVCVLIDRNLGGLAKDAWATEAGQEVVDRYAKECAASDLMTMEELEPVVARALVEHAFAVTERAMPHGPPISDEIRSFRAMVLARMRLLPSTAETTEPYAADDLRFRGDGWDAERARFLAVPDMKALGRPRIVKGCVDAILEYGEFCDDGRLLRVSPVKAELLLVDWLPAWAGLSPSQVAVMPEVLRLWCRHAARRLNLPDEILDETTASVDRFTLGLAAAVAEVDRSGYGFLREHVLGSDVWERADQANRLTFALPSIPGPRMFDEGLDAWEDGLHELVVLAHPEYDESLRTAHDPDPTEVDEVQPHLHVALHDIVASQLWQDNPPEVWIAARRLQLGDYDPHEIHHMLMNAVGEPIRRVMVDEQLFDLDLYIERLGALPGSWEAQRPVG